ncbi:response regulator transcription factor [Paraburkholderia sp. Ac-20336]|uniref:response regulator transcription factor n=1 Tax=Burkholderiaceae TaxID=119060 RepID=UPI00142213AF|nr:MULTISPECIES: response regulator transcription factor [Burkholderiaceae]MBN3801763.1 response regulator transcription factor [Paraburkholderia sp. Ac-20336]NIF51020.1 response regulator transcription factor [Burkholderia sp. Ax-1724]NIF75855.1 response regulator transcription factor [Paraburkholderia sp. Cy-641]
MRILVVEDDAEIGAAIRGRLSRLGHAVDLEMDGGVANNLLAVETFDLVVLDVMLPTLDGFAILRNLRAAGNTTPLLLLTARSAIDDRVSGLALGADDYLVKPFDYREFEARVQALLRRGSGQAHDLIRLGSLVIDRTNRLAECDRKPFPLSRQEFALLEILASRPQRVFSKEELLTLLFNFDKEPSANAVEQYVTRVRKKLQGAGVEIRTVRGVGYQIATL